METKARREPSEGARRAASCVYNFLQQIDWSLSGVDWKLAHLAAIIDRETHSAEPTVAAALAAQTEVDAQKVEHFLDALTAEEYPPHGLQEAARRWDSGHSEQFVKWAAAAIRKGGRDGK